MLRSASLAATCSGLVLGGGGRGGFFVGALMWCTRPGCRGSLVCSCARTCQQACSWWGDMRNSFQPVDRGNSTMLQLA